MTLNEPDSSDPKNEKKLEDEIERERPRHYLKRPWQAVAKRAGLDGVRIHDLRHTHASVGAGE